MKTLGRLIVIGVLGFVLLPTAVSLADSFVITDGTLGHGLFIAPRGSFNFSGPGITASGLIEDPITFGIQRPPGATIPSFSTRIAEQVSVPPSSFTVNGSPFSGQGAGYEFRVNGGPFTLPSLLQPSAIVEFPATFSGSLFQGFPTSPVHTLSGDVLASITFSGSTVSGFYTAQRFDATFVPEPTSVLLFGAGLVGIGIWRRKRANSATSATS